MASALEILALSQLSFWANKPTAVLEQTVGQSVASSTNTQLTFNSAVGDNWGAWAGGSPTRYTVQVAGTYRLDGLVAWPGNATGARYAQLYYNGVLINGSVSQWTTVPNGSSFMSTAGPVQQAANVGDYFQLNVYQTSGSALTTGTISTLVVEFLHY